MSGMKIDVGPVGERLAMNIQTIRSAKRLQYKELSELVGAAGRHIPPLGIRRIESHERRVDAQDLAVLAQVLGFPVEQLLFSNIELKAEYKVIAPNEDAVTSNGVTYLAGSLNE